MSNDTTILIRPATMYPVYLPQTDNKIGKWLNIALAISIDVIEQDPLVVLVRFPSTPPNRLEGIQAVAVIQALESFPHGKLQED